MIFKTNKAFSAVEVIIALSTILLIGAIVYTFVTNSNNPSPGQDIVLQDIPSVPEVTTVEDLSVIQEVLSEVDIDNNTSLLPSVDSDISDL
ncbi:hypothetical protein EOL73_01985 [Candidatus Saccharibacteria bacterium]|nr:hypothetical protein [Candidatus Saccharibacteria bacterium]NCU40506.1 hypothetical protein [Candidatus Saccharibacteria bacterium]